MGKTSILQRLRTGNFQSDYMTTIGSDFAPIDFDVDGDKVRLNIFDTAGQERYRSITRSYYRDAHGVILVYDITRRSTFLNIERWLKDVSEFCPQNVIIMVIGNKCDMESNRMVLTSEATKVVEKAIVKNIDYTQGRLLTVLETSAKMGTNIEEAFIYVAKHLREQYSKIQQYQRTHADSFRIGHMEMPTKKKRIGCCGRFT